MTLSHSWERVPEGRERGLSTAPQLSETERGEWRVTALPQPLSHSWERGA